MACVARALMLDVLQFEAFGKRDVAIKNEEAAGAFAAAASKAAARIAAYQVQSSDLNAQSADLNEKARAVGVMPKVKHFDGDDEEDTGKQQEEDTRNPAMFAYARQHPPHPAVSLPNNSESARPKPSSQI